MLRDLIKINTLCEPEEPQVVDIIVLWIWQTTFQKKCICWCEFQHGSTQGHKDNCPLARGASIHTDVVFESTAIMWLVCSCAKT